MLTALLLLAVNLRLAVTTASVLLPLLIDQGALSPQAAILVPALPTAMFAVGGVLTPWLSRRIGAVAAVTWAMAAVSIGMLVRFVPHSLAVVGGTALATAGIAVINVLLPALVRASSGTRMRAVTTAYTTVLSGAAAIGAAAAVARAPPRGAAGGRGGGGARGAAAAVPVAHAFGSASLGLGSWALFAVLALVIWVVAARGAGVDAALAPSASEGRVPLPQGTWALTGFFALQALLAFVIMGWLPTIAVESGISPARAGVLLGIVIMVSIPAGIGAVSIAHTLRGVRIGVVVVSLGTALGVLGLWLAPAAAPELWAVLMGIGMAAFPLTLALIARAGSGAAEATRVSGVAQGLGYALSTVGPLGAGAWYSSGGAWGPVLVGMAIGATVQGVIGLVLASPREQRSRAGTTR